MKARFAAIALSFLLLSCASDKYLRSGGHSEFDARNYEKAAEIFAKEAEKPGANQLLFILDEATSLFAAGKYAEATELFLKAEKLAEIKDYTSISEEVGTLVTSDNVRGYKGEDFEKILINVHLAIAYAALGKLEDAIVEARKINSLLYRMINEGKRNYEESPFARYFSAVLWEAGKQRNDAYIDYKKTYELDAAFPELGSDLKNFANQLHFFEDQRKWEQNFPGQLPRKLSKNDGELVILFEQGKGPIKVPLEQDSTLPKFITQFSSEETARTVVDGVPQENLYKVLDVEKLSIRYLQDRISRMSVAKLAGVATKAAVALGVGKATKNAELGWLAFYLLAATDRADLRSWKTLPASLQMRRMTLSSGKHKVSLDVLSSTGAVLRNVDLGEIEISPGKKIFRVVR